MKTIFDRNPLKDLITEVKTVTLDPEDYYKELLYLHKRRKSTKLLAKKAVSAKVLQRASAQDQAYRSRCIAVLAECKKLHNWIRPMVDHAKLQVITLCPGDVPPTPKGEKLAYLEHGINLRLPVIAALLNTIELANYVVEDIDKAAWNLKFQLQAFELVTRPEYIL